ncbi:unnamed protein product [Parnassius mnemosyne]|uniref:PiggyBac transposable element-derived protein domain-containing protein n=1 Tax=Parnassius mnemosyne TaxID=213953 RepID=A0AAV1KWF8_9NEOP
MDLRNQEEQIKPEDDIIRLSKRQRTQILDSDDSLEDIHETNSPQTSNQGNQRVLQVTPRFLYGKNKHKWSSVPRSATTRTLRRNIVHFIPGPRGKARELQEPIDLFRLFMTNDMLQQVVTFPNAEIITQRNRYKQESYTVSQTNLLEIKALLGLLLIAAAMKSNHLPNCILFNPQRSGTIFKACMSAEIFNFLIKCMRFDEKQTRNDRRKEDKFTHIRELWQNMIDNFQKWYTPGSYITVDEQLVSFRGRCPFRIYIPNKPNKYGIKLVMAADVNSKYVINAIPYLGKGTDTQKQPLATFFIKNITIPLHGTNRNITMDNWFTSVTLADELLQPPYNLTLVVSINAYAVYVSNDLRNKKKPTLRRNFVMKMGNQLMDPWLRERLQTVTLRRDIKVMIKDILD